LKLETAPAAGPWLQAATSQIRARRGGYAACQRSSATNSSQSPCLDQWVYTAYVPLPNCPLARLLAVTRAAPDCIWTVARESHWQTLPATCRPHAEPCLGSCTAPASPTPTRVLQLSLSCSRLVGGDETRDCNLPAGGQIRHVKPSGCYWHCSAKTARCWLGFHSKLDTHQNWLSALHLTVEKHPGSFSCPGRSDLDRAGHLKQNRAHRGRGNLPCCSLVCKSPLGPRAR